VQLIEGLIDQTSAWSVTASTLIASDEEQAGTAPLEEEPPLPQPAPRGNGRNQMVEDLL
jgi:hypothetical protein